MASDWVTPAGSFGPNQPNFLPFSLNCSSKFLKHEKKISETLVGNIRARGTIIGTLLDLINTRAKNLKLKLLLWKNTEEFNFLQLTYSFVKKKKKKLWKCRNVLGKKQCGMIDVSQWSLLKIWSKVLLCYDVERAILTYSGIKKYKFSKWIKFVGQRVINFTINVRQNKLNFKSLDKCLS